MTNAFQLECFDIKHTDEVISWAESETTCRFWCGTDHVAASLLSNSIADPDVRPYALCKMNMPVAYGEIRIDNQEEDLELARLIVAPTKRGQAIGRHLVSSLLARARELQNRDVYMRVAPDNEVALRCYEHSAFRRIPDAEQQQFNPIESTPYIWFRNRI